MSRKASIHVHLQAAAAELLGHVTDVESAFEDRWVPATQLKSDLGLKMMSYPKSNSINEETGWLFNTLARMLEDQSRLEFKKVGSRSFYRASRA